MGSKILKNIRCPKCGGRLYLDSWEQPPDLACINCGKRWVFQNELEEVQREDAD